jgi:KDO2-lipid IV(A) lauroyltransferase
VYRLSPVAEASRDNARHVLGPGADPERVSKLARRMFETRALGYYDMARLSATPLEELVPRLVLVGKEYLDPLVEAKQGALVVAGHLGPVEYMIQSVVCLGYPLIAISEHLEPERLDRYVRGLRTAHGLNLVSTKTSMLDIYRRLRRGELLASAIDRDSTDTGLVVDFMGAPAWMPDGYARVAVRANVPLIFGFCVQDGGGKVVTHVFPPIHPDRSLGKEQAVLDVIQRTLQMFEQVVRAHPEEWHLSTPVWRLAQERSEKESS